MPKDKKDITTGDIMEVLQDFIEMSAKEFGKVHERIEGIDARVGNMDARFEKIEKNMATKEDIARLVRKIDGVTDGILERVKEQANGLKALQEKVRMMK